MRSPDPVYKQVAVCGRDGLEGVQYPRVALGMRKSVVVLQ